MKTREITLGVTNNVRLVVYIERVGKADLVAIPELEWEYNHSRRGRREQLSRA
ncbi:MULTISPECIES: hypothetical protein [Brevibacillus]|jgi:hypothetical protein|uniref:hypothetical protein n=1 Tax=Brevibacillus TaxID=55080 RepID=UPI001F625524|nr:MULTISPECIES: hypothetical protein [Brevibacillus]